MIIYWSGLDLILTRSSTPLANLSNQIVWVTHLVITGFLVWSSPNESLSTIPLVEYFQNVEKSDQDLLKVSNCSNALILPGYRLCINMSTAGPITNSSLTGWLPKYGYDGAFPVSLHLIKFILTSNILFLIVEGYLPQPAYIMHLVMCIMNTI